MFCSNCGKENADVAKFCGGCGKPLASKALGSVPKIYVGEGSHVPHTDLKHKQSWLAIIVTIIIGIVGLLSIGSFDANNIVDTVLAKINQSSSVSSSNKYIYIQENDNVTQYLDSSQIVIRDGRSFEYFIINNFKKTGESINVRYMASCTGTGIRSQFLRRFDYSKHFGEGSLNYTTSEIDWEEERKDLKNGSILYNNIVKYCSNKGAK